MTKKKVGPPKFTNKKKAIQLVGCMSRSLKELETGLSITPTSLSWKESDDMTRALVDIETLLLEIKIKLLAAAS